MNPNDSDSKHYTPDFYASSFLSDNFKDSAKIVMHSEFVDSIGEGASDPISGSFDESTLDTVHPSYKYEQHNKDLNLAKTLVEMKELYDLYDDYNHSSPVPSGDYFKSFSNGDAVPISKSEGDDGRRYNIVYSSASLGKTYKFKSGFFGCHHELSKMMYSSLSNNDDWILQKGVFL